MGQQATSKALVRPAASCPEKEIRQHWQLPWGYSTSWLSLTYGGEGEKLQYLVDISAQGVYTVVRHKYSAL